MTTIKDAVYGLAVGDALGVPVEFKARDSFTVTNMLAYGSHNQPKGTWSDDTSMTLATCYSIQQTGGINPSDLKEQFRNWLYEKQFTATGEVFDVGFTTGRAIRKGYGDNRENANGNGSLMRILPLAFVDGVTDSQIAKVSALTHAHDTSCVACIIYVHIAQNLLAGQTILEAVKHAVSPTSQFANLLDIHTLPRDEIQSSGYVVDSLEAAIWCLATTDSYQDCVLKAVNLGRDTDTIGAIAGGLAGILYGYDAIPAQWIADLQNKPLVDGCLF